MQCGNSACGYWMQDICTKCGWTPSGPRAKADQLLSALAAVRHYARHLPPCKADYHADRMRASNFAGFSSVYHNPPTCTCGLDDVLRGIDAMLAGRDVGVVSKTETPQPESSACGCGVVRNAGDWPEDLALENPRLDECEIQQAEALRSAEVLAWIVAMCIVAVVAALAVGACS